MPKIETQEHDPIETVEKIVAAMPSCPEIEHAGSKAFYSSTADRITMQPRNLFVSAEEYSATLLHELTHSVGHEKRLARKSIVEAVAFGSQTYSEEELVVELGAAYLRAKARISNASRTRRRTLPAGFASFATIESF